MNTYTAIFQSKAALQVPAFGLLFLVLSFFTISSVKAQNISELNQFFSTQESVDLGIDQDYLYGSQSVAHVTRTRINLPEDGSPRKVDVRGNSLSRLSAVGDGLLSVEILQVKISTDSDKSASIPFDVLDQMPSLKVVLVISEVPISLSEVQTMVSSLTNPAIKILYIYSQPV